MSEPPDAGRAVPPRRTRRTILRFTAALAALVAVYALAGFFVVPRIARWAIVTRGGEALARPVALGSVAFNPFTLRAEMRALEVRDRDGQPLASLERLRLRLGPSGIFRRAWRLTEVAFDAPAVQVRFLPDGTLSIADLLEGEESGDAPPRVIVDRLSIRRGRLDYVDESSAPAFRAAFTPLDADVRDLVTIPGTAGDHALTIGFDGDSTARIEGRQTLEPFGIGGRVEVRRLALPALADRLAPGGALAVRAGSVDLTLDYEFRKEAGGMRLRATRGEVLATNVSLVSRAAATELLTAPRILVRDANIAFPARTVDVGSILVAEPRAAVGWDPEGRFNWSGPQAAAPESPPPASAQAATPPWTVRVARAAIERGTLRYEDAQKNPPVAFDVADLAIALTGLTQDASVPVSLAASGSTGTGILKVDGQLAFSPFFIDGSVGLAGVDAVPFRAYVESPGLTLGSGRIDFDGRLLVAPEQPYLVEGDGALAGVELLDRAGARLAGCRKATLRQLRVDGASSRSRIRSVVVDGLYANVAIDEARNINLATLAGPEAEPDAGEQDAGSFDIGVIELRDGTIDYRDDSLVLPFAAAITSTRGTITDFSTTSRAGATIRIAGEVPEHGSMKAEGTMRMADPFAGTDLAVTFRSVAMPTLTPYAAEFAGYSIRKGDLDLDMRYRIADKKLHGDHRIVARDMTLGGRVEGTEAGFAVRLAVALLKDREGRINLDVPVEGSVDSPEFDYRAVMWQAVKTILANIAKAPFRALGSAMGIGNGEDLQLVAFDAGDAAVLPAQEETLRKIAGELAARQGIDVEIEARYDPELDADPLRAAKLEALVASRRDAPEAAEPPSLDTILETLYAEAFSAERLEEERAKFTAAPPPPPAPPPRKLWQRRQAAPPPPPAVVDAGAFHEALRAQLAAAQPVGTDELRALGRARAGAIAAALTSGGTLGPERVRALDPAEARQAGDAKQVPAELKLAVADPSSGEDPDV